MSIFTNGGAPSQEALTTLLNALAPTTITGDTCNVRAIQPRGITGVRCLATYWLRTAR